MHSPQRIVVIGGANLDISGQSDKLIVPLDSNPGKVESAAGGVGRNVAENLARLGNPTALISILGDDLGRAVIEKSCDDCGLDRSGIAIDKQLTTGTYLSIVDDLGNLAVAISDMAIIDRLTPEVVAQHQTQLDNAEAMVVEANLPEATLAWIAQNNQGKTIHADAVSVAKAPKLRTLLNHLDILKINRAEAKAILKLPDIPCSDETMAKQLFDYGVNKVLLSKGGEGATLYTHDGAVSQPVINSFAVCDNGAGDALFAGLIHAQKTLRAPADQLTFAMACASLTMQSRHAVHSQLSNELIKKQFLSHLDQGAWYS